MLKVAYHPIYAHPLPENHRFPMLKYELIPEQLLHEGTITKENFFEPVECRHEVVLWTHDQAYFNKLLSQNLSPTEQRKIGFPQSIQLIQRELIITQGTIDCCNHAIKNGIALNIAGGTHHAFADRGEGFCLLNDFGIASTYLLRNKSASKIIIIDLDVHQGNGTAKLFQDEKRVFTFSMHGRNNYPFIKEISDLDIPLEAGIEDDEYLKLLQTNLQQILSLFKPDFAFYLSGVDVLSTDKFGKLNISIEGCKRRDEIVLSKLKELNIPCTVAMGGGYSPMIKTIVEAHCNTFRVAANLYF